MENNILKKVLNKVQDLCDNNQLDDKTRANLLAVIINSYILSRQEEVFLEELDENLIESQKEDLNGTDQ
jgi:hypothetical protein